MASRTWRYLYHIVSSFESLRVNQIPRLVPSQTQWTVYKINSKISIPQTNVGFVSILKKCVRKNYKTAQDLPNMGEDISDQSFQPPKSVRGMKKLDRTAFKQIVKIPAIKVKPLNHSINERI